MIFSQQIKDFRGFFNYGFDQWDLEEIRMISSRQILKNTLGNIPAIPSNEKEQKKRLITKREGGSKILDKY